MGGWRSLRRVPFFMSKAANATLSTGHGKEADARHAEVKIDIKKGIDVAASKLITVDEAGKRWTDAAEAERLQRATVRCYPQHVDLHIVPVLGPIKLSDITVPVVASLRGCCVSVACLLP